MLGLLAAAELLGMALWFAGSAAAPQLAAAWQLSPSAVGWLTNAVQIGFVVGTAVSALLNLADLVPARRLFASAALLGALVNLPLGYTTSYEVALLSRFLAGACLAGVYPPAMKMAATWFRSRRGLAVGTIVGALTVGKAVPYLAQAIPGAGVWHITVGSSAFALLGALLVWAGYRDGPYAFPSRPFSWSLVGEVLGGRRYRLALGGYLGHMAELYSFWTWIAAFLAASEVQRLLRAGTAPVPAWVVGVVSFGVIAVGGIGCIWGGVVADRIGRERLVIRAMAVSGACALLVGLGFGGSWWLLTPVALVWGFFVIADSAQFSVLVTESVPPDAVGTALTLQVSLGFLVTTLSIQLVPLDRARRRLGGGRSRCWRSGRCSASRASGGLGERHWFATRCADGRLVRCPNGGAGRGLAVLREAALVECGGESHQLPVGGSAAAQDVAERETRNRVRHRGGLAVLHARAVPFGLEAVLALHASGDVIVGEHGAEVARRAHVGGLEAERPVVAELAPSQWCDAIDVDRAHVVAPGRVAGRIGEQRPYRVGCGAQAQHAVHRAAGRHHEPAEEHGQHRGDDGATHEEDDGHDGRLRIRGRTRRAAA